MSSASHQPSPCDPLSAPHHNHLGLQLIRSVNSGRLEAQSGATTTNHGVIQHTDALHYGLTLSPPLLTQPHHRRYVPFRPIRYISHRLDISTDSWILDSGATRHLTTSTQYLTNTTSLSPTSNIHTANGTPLPITCVGHLNKPPQFSVSHVHHVPSSTMNIFSVSQLTALNYTVIFIVSSCVIQDP